MSGPVHYDVAAFEAADATARANLAARYRAAAESDEDRAVAELTITLHEATSMVTIAFTRALNAGVDIERIADQLGMGVAAIRAGTMKNLAQHGAALVYLAAEERTVMGILGGDFEGSVTTASPVQGGRA